jgi:hypothetical protein
VRRSCNCGLLSSLRAVSSLILFPISPHHDHWPAVLSIPAFTVNCRKADEDRCGASRGRLLSTALGQRTLNDKWFGGVVLLELPSTAVRDMITATRTRSGYWCPRCRKSGDSRSCEPWSG